IPPTASCSIPRPWLSSARMYWHTAGLWVYASIPFPQEDEEQVLLIVLFGPPGLGLPTLCFS
ncbi:hypothetical protein M9458_035345, partial [Cirrhinus mrigala]